MMRRPVPPAVWVLSGAAGISMTALTVMLLVTQGQHAFFSGGDSKFFLLIGKDLFGTGHNFSVLGAVAQAPYRYGRPGMPFVAWLLALGRPGLVGPMMIVVNVVTLTAIPGLAALLLAEHDAPPMAGAFVFALPAFVLLYGTIVSDALVVALMLLAYILDARSHHRSAIVVLAFAILVKEIALLALIPLAWRDPGARRARRRLSRGSGRAVRGVVRLGPRPHR